MAKIAAMLENAPENTAPPPPRAASGLAPARFARAAAEAQIKRPDWMTVLAGGALPGPQQEQLW